MRDVDFGAFTAQPYDVRAVVKEIHDPGRGWHGALIGLELWIEQDGELRESQLFRDRQALEARSHPADP